MPLKNCVISGVSSIGIQVHGVRIALPSSMLMHFYWLSFSIVLILFPLT